MKKTFLLAAVLLLCAFMIGARPWTSNQEKAHEMAELAREMGLPEDNPIIAEAQFLWWTETEDAKILANVLLGECKDCTDRHQQLTAMTVLNRVAMEDLPNTVKGVVTDKGQYSPAYARSLPDYITGDADTQRCFKNAYAAFIGLVECPENVIYASEFPPSVLGSGCYEESKTYIDGILYSTTYFNYR